jgi:hypothetical protein
VSASCTDFNDDKFDLSLKQRRGYDMKDLLFLVLSHTLFHLSVQRVNIEISTLGLLVVLSLGYVGDCPQYPRFNFGVFSPRGIGKKT